MQQVFYSNELFKTNRESFHKLKMYFLEKEKERVKNSREKFSIKNISSTYECKQNGGIEVRKSYGEIETLERLI